MPNQHGGQNIYEAKAYAQAVYANSNHGYPVAPNVLTRTFAAAVRNVVWVTGRTYAAMPEGWLYLAAVMELYCGGMIALAAGKADDASLVCNALAQAIGHTNPLRGVLCHSVPYASQADRARLRGCRQQAAKGDGCAIVDARKKGKKVVQTLFDVMP